MLDGELRTGDGTVTGDDRYVRLVDQSQAFLAVDELPTFPVRTILRHSVRAAQHAAARSEPAPPGAP